MRSSTKPMDASTEGNSYHHPKPPVVSGASGQPFLSRPPGKRDKPIILKAGKSNLLHGDRGHSGGSLWGPGWGRGGSEGIDTESPLECCAGSTSRSLYFWIRVVATELCMYTGKDSSGYRVGYRHFVVQKL